MLHLGWYLHGGPVAAEAWHTTIILPSLFSETTIYYILRNSIANQLMLMYFHWIPLISARSIYAECGLSKGGENHNWRSGGKEPTACLRTGVAWLWRLTAFGKGKGSKHEPNVLKIWWSRDLKSTSYQLKISYDSLGQFRYPASYGQTPKVWSLKGPPKFTGTTPTPGCNLDISAGGNSMNFAHVLTYANTFRYIYRYIYSII